jgi:hypothetical protein
MSRFLEDAGRIFEAAESVSASGQVVSDVTILVGAEGGVHLLADSDWPLDRLLAERGAWTAYRVSERAGQVKLEGRAGARACLLQAETPQSIARRLLNSIPAPHPAGT